MGRWAATGAGATALAAIVFGPHLRGAWVWDDAPLIQHNPDLQPSGSLWHLVTGPIEPGASVYRPLSMATFWIQARLFGLGVPGFRAVDVALHAAVAVALVALLRRLGVGALAAVLAAAVFLVHPSVTEPVMWIDGRHDTLGALLGLGALLLFVPGEGAADPPRSWAAVLAGLALLCKETFVALPLLAALDEARRAVASKTRPHPERLRALALFAAPVPAYFALRFALDIPGGGLGGVSPAELLRAWATVIGRYALQLLSLSNGPTVETFVPWSAGRVAPVTALLAGALAALGAASRRGARSAGIAFFGLAWFAVALAPAALAIAIAGQYANRYAYFPLAGLTVALAAGLDRLLALVTSLASLAARRAVAGIVVMIVAGLAFHTSAEAALWRDEASLFGADVSRLPDDGRALFHFAVDLQRREGCEAALPLFAGATRRAPTYVRAWHNLAGCLLRERRFAEAVEPARRATLLDPDNARRHFNLGLALAGAGDSTGAAASFTRALALDPGYLPARKELDRLRPQGTP